MGMKVKKIFSAIMVFMFTVCMLSALSIEFDFGGDDGAREPDKRKRREDDLVAVIIRTTNVSDAEVYLNGTLVGKTPYATAELSASYYRLEIRKNGYDTIKCKIYPRKRYTYTYEFEMQKTCGFINVKNYPAGSTIYIDGSSTSSFPKEVSPGSHTVKVRKFGYEDFVQRVEVENHKTVNVNVSLVVAPFRISNFSISKNKINPDYTSGIGKVTFSFDVTNDGSAILTVCDRYGNIVWSHEYTSFSTWEHSITWSGTDSYGESLPDGQYTVNLSSFDYDQSLPIKIDRSMVYPLSVFTPSGSGIGSLPCAFGDGVNYVKLFVDFGPVMDLNSDAIKLYSLPVNAGIVIDFAHYNEFAFSFGGAMATPSCDKTPFLGSASYKRNFCLNLGSGTKLDFAGLIDYSFSSVPDYALLGSNVGKGLGLGLAAGLETKLIYFGLSGEYSFGSTRVRSDSAEDILKYGATFSVTPVKNLRTSAWAAMYNNKVIEAGLELISMPGSGAFCCDAKASVLTDLSSENKNMFINARFGLSYLF